MFNFFKKEVYCQFCGREITGGFVATNKNIYCGHNNSYCLKEVSKINPDIKFEYKDRDEIQKDIKQKEIIHFSKLEKSV